MPTITIPKKEYLHILEKQFQFEEELDVLKHVIYDELDEARIRPSTLKKWDRISRDMDKGKGRSFASMKTLKSWLAAL